MEYKIIKLFLSSIISFDTRRSNSHSRVLKSMLHEAIKLYRCLIDQEKPEITVVRKTTPKSNHQTRYSIIIINHAKRLGNAPPAAKFLPEKALDNQFRHLQIVHCCPAFNIFKSNTGRPSHSAPMLKVYDAWTVDDCASSSVQARREEAILSSLAFQNQ